jgi:peptidoglycan/LPS O-acetylase OafA/YrhL
MAERMENHKLLNKFNHLLSIVGIYSFEVYLVHVFLYENLMYRILHLFPSISDNLLWLLTIPVIICGTWILNRIAAFVSNLFHQKKHG